MGPLGFPWGLLGLSQYRTPLTLALAPIAGVFGLGALIVLINATIAEILVIRRVTLATGLAVLVVAVSIGAAHLRPASPPDGTRIVAAIQPNVPPQAKGEPLLSASIIEGLLRQTDDARDAGAELIVYPETAVPLDLSTDAGTRTLITRSARGAVVVAGAFLPGPQNGVIVLDGEGHAIGRYAKRRLVPFGEAGMRPGHDAEPVRSPVGMIGLAICYESAFTDLIRPIAADGADLLVVLTNDGWFGTSAGPAQHAAHSILRAAETGRAVVRAANTGTSMIVRPDGTVVGAQRLGTPGIVVAAVPIGGPPTPYVRWGWLIAPVAILGWLIAAAPVGWVAVRRQPEGALRLAVAVVLPGLFWLVHGVLLSEVGWASWVTPVIVLGLSARVARGRLFNRGGVLWSTGLSLAVTAVLIAAMRAAYAQYGFLLPIGPARGRWVEWLVPHLLEGVAAEAWLRGAVFATAADLGGWPLATALSTILGIALHLGQPQEIIFWHLFTCVAFSAIRVWTKDALGLGPARGLGDAVVLGLADLR
jgi:apolipoprotein N-acyltransferase